MSTIDTSASSAQLDADGKILKRFLSQLSEADAAHAERINKWREMDRAYHGQLKSQARGEAPLESKNNVYPKYAHSVVETMAAGMDDDKPTLRISPTTTNPDQVAGAKCLEHLIAHQRKLLGFNAERSMFINQALRRGVSIGKVPWVYETIKTQQRIFAPQDPNAPGLIPTVSGMAHAGYSAPKETVTRQGAGFVCCDVIDCPWDPGATRPGDITHIFFKTYQTIDELERMRDLGVYSWPDGTKPQTGTAQNEVSSNQHRNTKNRVLVIERWELRATGVWLTVTAGKSLVIRDCASPLRHEKLPFVFASPSPGMFSVEGMSEVEIVMEEQAAIWELLNQSIENARYQNNATWFFDESMRGADDIVLGPGARNYVQGDPNQRIKQFQPVQTLQFAQPLIEMLITEMQSVSAGANPYMSGNDSDSINQETATGIQLIQNMAQKRVQRKKEEILAADREIGLQQIQLNQQLLPNTVVWAVEDSTSDTGYQQIAVDPAQIQGEYSYDTEEIAEDLSDQQKRQEAQNKVTTLLQIQTVAMQIPPGVLPLINFSAMIEDFTESYDDKPDRFLAAPPPTTPGGGVQPPYPPPAGATILGGAPAPPATGAPGLSGPIPVPVGS